MLAFDCVNRYIIIYLAIGYSIFHYSSFNIFKASRRIEGNYFSYNFEVRYLCEKSVNQSCGSFYYLQLLIQLFSIGLIVLPEIEINPLSIPLLEMIFHFVFVLFSLFSSAFHPTKINNPSAPQYSVVFFIKLWTSKFLLSDKDRITIAYPRMAVNNVGTS